MNYQYYKEGIICGKTTPKIYNIVKKHDNDIFWKRFFKSLNSLSKKEINYNDGKELTIPLLIYKFEQRRVDWRISKPDYIKKHPFLPEFKRQVKTFEVEEILQRIGINIYENDHEK